MDRKQTLDNFYLFSRGPRASTVQNSFFFERSRDNYVDFKEGKCRLEWFIFMFFRVSVLKNRSEAADMEPKRIRKVYAQIGYFSRTNQNREHFYYFFFNAYDLDSTEAIYGIRKNSNNLRTYQVFFVNFSSIQSSLISVFLRNFDTKRPFRGYA